jgi:hypothetical protein
MTTGIATPGNGTEPRSAITGNVKRSLMANPLVKREKTAFGAS